MTKKRVGAPTENNRSTKYYKLTTPRGTQDRGGVVGASVGSHLAGFAACLRRRLPCAASTSFGSALVAVLA